MGKEWTIYNFRSQEKTFAFSLTNDIKIFYENYRTRTRYDLLHNHYIIIDL